MATSLGMFGGTFGATLEKSFDDRASYESGAAVRIADIRASGSSVQQLEAPLADAPGIRTDVDRDPPPTPASRGARWT